MSMEGAFEHRHRLEKELKRAQKKIEEGDESG